MRHAVLLAWLGLATAGAGDVAGALPALAAPPTGGLALAVDGRELPRGLLHARLTLAATPGELALCYPKWIPGTHAPGGPVGNLGGLMVRDQDGRAVEWRRDEADAWRFLVSVPSSASALTIDLTYLANQPGPNSLGADVVGGAGLGVVAWNACLLCPAGRPVATVPVAASFTAPAGWTVASALPVAGVAGATTTFARVSLRDLVDAPLIAGPGLISQRLAGAEPPVWLHAVDEHGGPTRLDPAWAERLGRCAAQARALFGRAHYRRYHFLVVAGQQVHGIGLEHAESSLSGVAATSLADLAGAPYWDRVVAPHEFVHSWCGKHVRPAGLATADFQQAQRGGLLWVYEGLTTWYGQVLAVRSGLVAADELRAELALAIDALAHQGGRRWRSLEDTASGGWLDRAPARAWAGLRRGQDYYDEGALFWLRADLIIRIGSGGARSLDDFCRRFFGAPVEPGAVRTYQRADLIAALAAEQAHDWSALVRRHIEEVRPDLDTAFLADAGWRLVYGDEPSRAERQREHSGLVSQRAGLGCAFHGGWVREVVPGSPADRAGLHDGQWAGRVGGAAFTADALRAALSAARAGTGQVLLTVRDGTREQEIAIACSSGPRHAVLERVDGTVDRLAEMLAPR